MPAPPPSTEIVAYWKMEEVTGADRLDATGNGHTAVPTGDPSSVTQVTGRVGYGAQFPIATPTPTWLEVADAASLHLGDIDQTYWGWYKPNNFLAGCTMMDKAGQYNFQAFRSTGHDWLESYDFYYGGGAAFTRVSYAYTWAAADWQFWMVEYISATKRINLYRNSVASSVDTAVMPFIPISTTAVLKMGGTSSSSAGHTSVMDETGISRAIFTDDEKQCIYNGGAGGTYPYFCADAGIAFEGYAARLLSGSNYSGATYGAKTYFIIPGPVAGKERKVTMPFVDWNGAQPGDKVALKIERDGDDPNDASTNACSLETVAIDYYTKVN